MSTLPQEETRRCTGCLEHKPLSEYLIKNPKTGQHRARCRECHNAEKAAYKAKNRETVKAKDAEYREAKREELRQTQKEWRAANAERAKEIQRTSRAKHADRLKRYNSAYQKANAPLYRAAWNRRRTLLQTNGGAYTAQQWEDLKAAQDNRCLGCGIQEPQITLTVDHIIPVSRGGGSEIGNIQGLCQPCNSSKGAQTLDLRKD